MKSIEYLVTGEEMQAYDKNTTEQFKLPSIVLMEQAALAFAEEVVRLCPSKFHKVLVLAGKGNNGGDAMAVGRILFQKGYPVTLCLVGSDKDSAAELGEAASVQFSVLEHMKIPIVTNLETDSYDIIIDGIFGVGLNRDITGKTAQLIERVNTYGGKKFAIDIPSGIDAATGEVHNVAFLADYTITFAFLKRGLVLYPGDQYAGKIIKKEIGITEQSFLGKSPQMFALTGKVSEYLPPRDPRGHKGTFGKVLLVAGSETIGGAAILAGKAALMSGCGMLRICTHREQKTAILSSLPEAMVNAYEQTQEALQMLQEGMAWADVIAIGPGIGKDSHAEAMLKCVLHHSVKPLVIDADAINLLQQEECFKILEKRQADEESRREIVITPHLMELCRISRCSKEVLLERGVEIVRELAEKLGAVIIKKDAKTIICSKNAPLAINLCGNSGMATAGSGDVLTGITAAMLALGLPAYQAAVLAVYIHGKAGDEAALLKGKYSLLAGDLCDALPQVLK